MTASAQLALCGFSVGSQDFPEDRRLIKVPMCPPSEISEKSSTSGLYFCAGVLSCINDRDHMSLGFATSTSCASERRLISHVNLCFLHRNSS